LAARWPLGRQLDESPKIDALLPRFEPGTSMATRKASAAVLRALTPHVPTLIGGSADLAGSTGTDRPGVGAVSRGDFSGASVHFGIREHAMAGVLNGLALHGGVRPFGSTFLVFSDYLRPALRLSALMELPVLYILSHDSVAVGEDGPTHQPVEHIEALRLIPGVAVLRPADANETAACWALALRRTAGPTVLVLSRQDLPVLDPPPPGALDAHGAWAVYQPAGEPDVILAATGSEVSLAITAAQALAQDHRLRVRVVSIAWRERFVASGAARVLVPAGVPCVWIEAGVSGGWRGLARPGDDVIGLDQFGASGPGPQIYARMGFTAENIAERALACVRRQSDKGRDICRTS
jgi:transketolase